MWGGHRGENKVLICIKISVNWHKVTGRGSSFMTLSSILKETNGIGNICREEKHKPSISSPLLDGDWIMCFVSYFVRVKVFVIINLVT